MSYRIKSNEIGLSQLRSAKMIGAIDVLIGLGTFLPGPKTCARGLPKLPCTHCRGSLPVPATNRPPERCGAPVVESVDAPPRSSLLRLFRRLERTGRILPSPRIHVLFDERIDPSISFAVMFGRASKNGSTTRGKEDSQSGDAPLHGVHVHRVTLCIQGCNPCGLAFCALRFDLEVFAFLVC